MDYNKSIAKYERTKLCDTHKCQWCDEICESDECEYEVNFGWLCYQCVSALRSRGEPLAIVH